MSLRLYNTLTVLAWLLDGISPQHHWKQRLKALLAQHAVGGGSDLATAFPLTSALIAVQPEQPGDRVSRRHRG